MFPLSNRVLIIALSLTLTSAFAQSAADLESPNVKRVASRLACQCGSCKSTIACDMPGGCGFCKRVKTKIANMQTVGMSDKQIIASVVKDDGPQMYLAEPGAWGWLTPYLAVALGLIVIFFFVRRSLGTPTPATVPSDVFDRYHDRMEKDLEKLE